MLSRISAEDCVPPDARRGLYEAIEALARAGAPAAEVALAESVARAVHRLEFALHHSAAPDRIYARKALERTRAAWTKHSRSARTGAWQAGPQELAA
ncbi:MAG: hypothetical protein JOZ90_11715 [Alphaproteobacteria bacterium]|nr:hypothetical protein [Alphaproteobacteria bacterium]MBV9371289.1 hypothetical protein [Alphaproteobacteria bacterium]MBV9901753.1 hypothetical protein [Alphaproteobacteria bacterium]